MRHIFLAATAVGLIALAACNKQDDAADAVDAAQDATAAAVGTVAAPAAAMTTQGFVDAAAVSDMYEVEAGKLAGSKATGPEVKAFGKMMAEMHTATTKELGPLAKAAGITPPAAMDERRQGMLDNLKSASQADFDKTYLDQQAAAHDEALTLFRNYADGGDNAEIKAFATKTAPVVELHLSKAKELQSAVAAPK